MEHFDNPRGKFATYEMTFRVFSGLFCGEYDFNVFMVNEDSYLTSKARGILPRFDNFPDFYASLSPEQNTHIRGLVDWVSTTYPEFVPVIAWNQPMFKVGKKYIVGFMPAKTYTNVLTVTNTPITELSEVFEGYTHGTRSFRIGFDQGIDPDVFDKIIQIRFREEGL